MQRSVLKAAPVSSAPASSSSAMPQRRANRDAASLSPDGVAIRFDGVTVRFRPDVQALAGINLHIRTGEFVSIVGPSGCGKTTLLNYAAGLAPATHLDGAVRVHGQAPVTGHRALAYMLARDALCPWRTALGNAELGCEVRGMAKAERRERAAYYLDKIGLGAFADSFPSALSHGMRQRVALARTFAMDSSILLMDEPFGALDAQTKLQLEDLLLSLWEKEQRTILFITHDLSEAVSMSDRVVVMSARPGRIIADVPIDLPRPRSVRALQKDPAYHQLYSQVWEKLEEGLKHE
ncbi:ABC transporter ATP-binding protein [Cupriavidus necator]|uniref:ABC transporter ATP-binding protein n=1 Tax=Cupriavidus necator TaxID=106590 RepID=UPI00277DECD4|nr:ABC transporter ATP-binding protein [Cupriavidus necator]MDQ0141818.1 NitT/TauT family transport system ATP-binding protein [Cupriavidus necator]